MFAFLLTTLLVAQSSYETEWGEEFVDPFGEEQDAGTVPEEPTPDPAPVDPFETEPQPEEKAPEASESAKEVSEPEIPFPSPPQYRREGDPPPPEPKAEEQQPQPKVQQPQPAIDPTPEPEATPEPQAPVAVPDQPNQKPRRNFRLPEVEGTEGPVSQEFRRKEFTERGTPVGTWGYNFDIGGAINTNRRPTQVAFELEGFYRIWESFEVHGLLNFRFVDDRILGILVMPTWNFKLTERSETRIDLQVGLGMGWVLRGIQGIDYQFGYFPLRPSISSIFYAYEDFAIIASLEPEIFLYRVDTAGRATNELGASQGPPSQLQITAGLRFEY